MARSTFSQAFVGVALAAATFTALNFAPKVVAPKLASSLSGADVALAQEGDIASGHYKKLNDSTYLLVLQPGAKLLSSIASFQAQAGIRSGSLSGVGVTRNTTLGFYRFRPDGTPGKTHSDDTVREPREVVSLTCVLTTAFAGPDDRLHPAPPHCHIALAGAENQAPGIGKGWPVVGGHLIEAEVAVTAELIVNAFPTAVKKKDGGIFGGLLIDLGREQGGTPLRALRRP